jgi:hypothetical protein
MRSTLNLLIPAVLLLSCIPAGFAVSHATSSIGLTSDTDYYQAAAAMILQLLGLLTFILPTLSHPRLSQLTWLWIWMLAGFGAICAVASVLIYTRAPTFWSFVLAFAGSLAQVVVQLQVINAM